jgi:hypothetical protein
VYVHVCWYVRTNICVRAYVNVWRCKYGSMYLYVCVCACMYACMHACTRVRMTCVLLRYEWRYVKKFKISFVTQSYFSSSSCEVINETADIWQGGNEKYSTSTQGFVLCTYIVIISTSCQQRIHSFSILNRSIYWLFTLL